MRGLEIILMGIYSAMQNGTNYTDGRPPEINDKLDMSKLNVSLADNNLKSRDNKMPTEITVTTWQNMPYSGTKHVNGILTGEGYAFDILHFIQRKLNFTYTIRNADSIGDSTDGMIGLLNKQEADMAVAFIPMISDLNDLCDFSGIMDDVEITFMMKRPSESATGSGLLAPFNVTVWLCILISWIVVGPTMYILIFIRSKIPTNGRPEKYSFSTCVWFTYGALLKQGTTSEPVTNSTRLLFATWWIFITILTSFYTANLTAFLTLSEFTLPYNTANDIARERHKWSTFKHLTVHDILNREHPVDSLRLLKNSAQHTNVKYIEREDGDNAVFEWANRDYIFLGERYYIRSIIFNDYNKKTRDGMEETERCTYVMLPQNIYVMSRAFAYPKNSPLQEHMNKHLMNLVETGIVKHLRSNDVPSVNICPLNLKSKERRLRNADLAMTYKVVAVGFALSIIVFLGEMIYRFAKLNNYSKFSSCCRPCCFSQVETSILPIHTVDPRPEYLKQNPFNNFGKLYHQHGAKKNFINGREYWVITEDGDRRLVPIRTPSALLFHNTIQ